MYSHHHHHQPPPSHPPRSRTTTPSAASSSPAVRRGLYAYVGHRVVELLTEQQLVDHAVSVLPQLQSVTSRPHFHGPHWTTLRTKHGVELFEFDPSPRHGTTLTQNSRASLYAPRSSTAASSSQATTTTAASSTHVDAPLPSSIPRTSSLPHGFQTKFKLPNPGIDMTYAAVAICELEGSVSDVVDALFNDDAVEFEGSMRALWAHKLKRGDLLLSRHVRSRSATFTDSSSRSTNLQHTPRELDELLVAEPGRLAIKTATVGAGLSLKRKQMGAEKLCYTSFTQATPAAHEAYHVIKTLPRDVHDQIACGKTHVALHDASVDHIAVGYHLTGVRSVLGGARTRLVVCAYASSVDDTATTTTASQLHWHPRMEPYAKSQQELRGVNADTRRVVLLLAKAARTFQQIVRQRRFGSQRFVYFPTDRMSCRAPLEQSCVVCLRRFGFFRKDHYCQLCGHLVCRTCSKKHKVEPFAGHVRENRICFPCVARVDSGTFHDEQLWRGMGRAVVVDADVISPLGVDPILEAEPLHDHDHEIMQGRNRDSIKMTAFELATLGAGDEDGYDDAGLDRSFGSTGSGSASTVPSSSSHGREIQVAHDLFSPHPQRRASALEALSRVVLEARNSGVDHGRVATPRARAMDPTVVDKYIEDTTTTTTTTTTRVSDVAKKQRRAVATKSDRMPTFAVCYPRANPTTSRSYVPTTPLLESVDQQYQEYEPYQLPYQHRRSTLAIDTAAFDSICEAVVQRLGYALAFLVIQRRTGKPQIVGMHQVPQLRNRVPRHVDLASYCPSGFTAEGSRPCVVVEPTHDPRFRHFALVHDARIRFFAEFPVLRVHAAAASVAASGPHAVIAASLCVMDTGLRGHELERYELQTVATLCAVASDLIAVIAP